MNTYPILTAPPTLAAWFNAVKQDGANPSPFDTESASVLGAVDRQTRQFLYDMLATFLSSTNTILPAAIDATTLANKITTAMLQAGSVTQTVLAANSVGTTQIIDGNITTAKLAGTVLSNYINLSMTNWLTLAMIPDQLITAAKILNGSISTTQLADAAVTTPKLVDGAVTLSKMANALNAGYILVSGVAPFAWQAVPLTGDATIDATGKITFTARGIVQVAEQATLGTNAGSSLATTKITRGASTNTNCIWVELTDAQGLLTAPTNDGKLNLVGGTYEVQCSVPGFGVGKHRAFVEVYSQGGVLQQTLVGSSETAVASNQSSSMIIGQVTVPTNGYLLITHYTTTAVATTGLGQACNVSPNVENYSMITLTKLS